MRLLYLNSNQWVRSDDIRKKILVAPCPAPNFCGLTIDSYTPPKELDGHFAEVLKPKAVLVPTAAVDDQDVAQVDSGDQCAGEKIDGTRCPRSFLDDGGDIELKMCRRCAQKKKDITAKALKIAGPEEPERIKPSSSVTETKANDQAKKRTKSSGKTMNLDQMLKR